MQLCQVLRLHALCITELVISNSFIGRSPEVSAYMAQTFKMSVSNFLRCFSPLARIKLANNECHIHLIPCLDVDECRNSRNDCHVNADCINTFGSFNCTCKAGSTGDGRTCSGRVQLKLNHRKISFSYWTGGLHQD